MNPQGERRGNAWYWKERHGDLVVEFHRYAKGTGIIGGDLFFSVFIPDGRKINSHVYRDAKWTPWNWFRSMHSIESRNLRRTLRRARELQNSPFDSFENVQ